jgi:hypothetical protein
MVTSGKVIWTVGVEKSTEKLRCSCHTLQPSTSIPWSSAVSSSSRSSNSASVSSASITSSKTQELWQNASASCRTFIGLPKTYLVVVVVVHVDAGVHECLQFVHVCA